jgi:hypothetical protein
MGGNVFANGLEISGKAVDAKTIAAMPDVCFTPPENPATPPGVPIPYPSFGMASDAENGTATVFISGKTVNIKNKSDESKTSGTEAGCAAKKGVITSKNTGKKYFNSWSSDVKFEGEPVIRFSDLATHNHASPAANTPPWPEVAKFIPRKLNCEKILDDFGLHVHGDTKHKCPDGHESEHFVQNEYLQYDRDANVTAPQFENYDQYKAPCICMESYNKHTKGPKKGKYNPESKRGSPHNLKTKQCNKAIRERTDTPTLKEAIKHSCKAVVDNDPRCTNDKQRKEVAECLEAVFMAYMDEAVKEKDPSNSATAAADEPIAFEVNPDPTKLWVRI